MCTNFSFFFFDPIVNVVVNVCMLVLFMAAVLELAQCGLHRFSFHKNWFQPSILPTEVALCFDLFGLSFFMLE